MTNFDSYRDSFRMISSLNEKFQTPALKNRISPQALIVLLALNCGADLSFLVKQEYINELLNFGFAEKNGNELVSTGKGAILAKSLEKSV